MNMQEQILNELKMIRSLLERQQNIQVTQRDPKEVMKEVMSMLPESISKYLTPKES